MTLIIQAPSQPVPPLSKEQRDAIFAALAELKSHRSVAAHCDSPQCDCETWVYWDDESEDGDVNSVIDFVRSRLTKELADARISRAQILVATDDFFGVTPTAPRCDSTRL